MAEEKINESGKYVFTDLEKYFMISMLGATARFIIASDSAKDICALVSDKKFILKDENNEVMEAYTILICKYETISVSIIVNYSDDDVAFILFNPEEDPEHQVIMKSINKEEADFLKTQYLVPIVDKYNSVKNSVTE